MPRQGQRKQQRNPREQGWDAKANRQYEEIKSSQLDRGASTDRAEEIAARTVNKNRARSGQADQASPVSLEGESPQQRGGAGPDEAWAQAADRRRHSSTTMRRNATSRAGPP